MTVVSEADGETEIAVVDGKRQMNDYKIRQLGMMKKRILSYSKNEISLSMLVGDLTCLKDLVFEDQDSCLPGFNELLLNLESIAANISINNGVYDDLDRQIISENLPKLIQLIDRQQRD